MNPANGFQLWSEGFDLDEKEAFAFRAKSVSGITRALGIQPASLSAGSYAAPIAAAHNDYLMGRFFFAKRTDDALKKALEHFKRAATDDPNYAPIQTGLADTYSVMAERGILPSIPAHRQAKAAALRALSLDSTGAETYVALGTITSTSDKDFRAAEKYYLQALALNPGLVTAHQSYSYMLMKLRRFEESLQHARRALEIDPLSNPANINLAVLFFYMRDYEALVQQCQKMLELDPQHSLAHLMTAQALARMGRGAAAYQQFASLTDRPKDHPLIVRMHAEISAVLGRPDLAEKDLQTLLQEKGAAGFFSSSYIAVVYASLGQKDRAFAWLEKAYSEQDSFLSLLQVYPSFDSLRSDRRYASLLRRIGITEGTESNSVRIP
jgi:adenylate cyclase